MLSEDTLLGLKLPASEESPPANAAPAIALPFRLISVPRIPFFRHFHFYSICFQFYVKSFPFELTQEIEVARM